MKLVDNITGVEVLAGDECIALLATEEVGRLAVSVSGHPHVVPVNYVMDGDAVVFRSGDGTKFSAAGTVVAFEVDRFDRGTRSGWSVVVQGRAEEVTAADQPELVERVSSLPLSPWASFDKPHLLRIRPTHISGRRVG
jgi:nitroimidazol reductase NimA-like FMN-containing flavoprotein (pyridoxamine 5'-phosphate oxidase superfamily)